MRRPEQYFSWGTYNISNHLGAAFLTSLVTPKEPGLRTWRLVTGITSRAVVAINGKVAFDTDEHPVAHGGQCLHLRIPAELPEGESAVTVGLFRLGRMAQVGFRLEVVRQRC